MKTRSVKGVFVSLSLRHLWTKRGIMRLDRGYRLNTGKRFHTALVKHHWAIEGMHVLFV